VQDESAQEAATTIPLLLTTDIVRACPYGIKISDNKSIIKISFFILTPN
jgi:hypothetical protein